MLAVNIEPGKGVQQLNTANRNPEQIKETVYHKGRKVAPYPRKDSHNILIIFQVKIQKEDFQNIPFAQ